MNKLAFKSVATKFDAVYREKDGKVGQWMGDLPSTDIDSNEFDEFSIKFGIKSYDSGPLKALNMKDPDMNQSRTAQNVLIKYLRDH